MRKSLIIILIFTLFLDGIGGILDSRRSACGNVSVFYVSTDANDHEEKENNQRDSREASKTVTEDDYFRRSAVDIKADPDIDLNREHYSDLYISHYPWTSKEIHTPPPKA
jgi:hypothetical protein